MDITEILTAVVSGFAGVAATAAALAPKIKAARDALAPLLGRRTLKIVVLVEREKLEEAKAFAAQIRKAGYREVLVTATPAAAAGGGVIVVWHPTPEPSPTSMGSVALVGAVMDAAPETQILVLTYPQLPLKRCAQILISNHEVRLLGDLATLAEQAKVRS